MVHSILEHNDCRDCTAAEGSSWAHSMAASGLAQSQVLNSKKLAVASAHPSARISDYIFWTRDHSTWLWQRVSCYF